MENNNGELPTDRKWVTLPVEIWNILEKELKGILGRSPPDIASNIVMLYLNERGLIDRSLYQRFKK